MSIEMMKQICCILDWVANFRTKRLDPFFRHTPSQMSTWNCHVIFISIILIYILFIESWFYGYFMAIIRLGNCSNWLLGLWIPPPVAHPSSRTQGDCPGGDVFAGLKPLDFATAVHGEKNHGFRWKFSTKKQSPMIQQTMKFVWFGNI